MRYAINLYDWLKDLKNDKLTPQSLLLKNLIKGELETVKCEGRRIDGDSPLVREDVTSTKRKKGYGRIHSPSN